MEKQDVFSGYGYLSATANDAYALDTITQDGGEGDFAALNYIQAIWNLSSISDFTACSADTLVTNELLEDGDNLIIRKSNNDMVPFVASGVSGSGPYTMDTLSVSEGEVPVDIYKNNVNLLYNGDEALLSSETFSVGEGIELSDNGEFDDNIVGWEQDGSSDMEIIWNAWHLRITAAGADTIHRVKELPTIPGKEYHIQIGTDSSHSTTKTRVHHGNGTLIHEMSYEEEYGEHIVAVSDSIYIEVDLELTAYVEYDYMRLKEKSAKVDKWYQDKTITGTTLETRFNLKIKGNELRYSKCSVFRDKI